MALKTLQVIFEVWYVWIVGISILHITVVAKRMYRGFKAQIDCRISPVVTVSNSADRKDCVQILRTLYPGTIHLPFETSLLVRSSISGLAAATSS